MAQKPFILFADADEKTLDTFRRYVETFGWTADYVKTAADIIAKVNENCNPNVPRCYDAVVCDVAFFEPAAVGGPGLSGVAAARSIRETHPDLPVVFVTSYTTYFIKDEINRVGAEYFAKPVDFERLFERLAFLIHWNWAIEPKTVESDRRRQAINQTEHSRRKTDRVVSVPDILQATIDEIRSERRSENVRQIGSGH